jgi:hypothetical protein
MLVPVWAHAYVAIVSKRVVAVFVLVTVGPFFSMSPAFIFFTPSSTVRFVSALCQHFLSEHSHTRSSNITAGSTRNIQDVVDARLLTVAIAALGNTASVAAATGTGTGTGTGTAITATGTGTSTGTAAAAGTASGERQDVRNECAWCVCNALCGSAPAQRQQLLDDGALQVCGFCRVGVVGWRPYFCLTCLYLSSCTCTSHVHLASSGQSLESIYRTCTCSLFFSQRHTLSHSLLPCFFFPSLSPLPAPLRPVPISAPRRASPSSASRPATRASRWWSSTASKLRCAT